MTGGDGVHHPSMHCGKRQGKTSRETCNLRHSEVIVWKLSYNSKLCVKLRSSNCLWCQRCSVNGIQCLWQLLETEGCITSCQQMIFFTFVYHEEPFRYQVYRTARSIQSCSLGLHFPSLDPICLCLLGCFVWPAQYVLYGCMYAHVCCFSFSPYLARVFCSNFRRSAGFIVAPSQVQGKLKWENSLASFLFSSSSPSIHLSNALRSLSSSAFWTTNTSSLAEAELTNTQKPCSRSAGLHRALAEDLLLKLAWLLLLLLLLH